MKTLKQTYTELLEFLCLTTNDENELGVNVAGLTYPLLSGESPIHVVADEMLAELERGDLCTDDVPKELAWFFPFAEDHARGKSNVIQATALAIRVKANVKAYALMNCLLELCCDTKKHKKIKPSAKGLLTAVGKVDDKTFGAFNKIMTGTDFMTKGLMLTTSLVYNAKVGNVSYPRVASVSSEFFNDLNATEVKKVLGVNVSRKMDQHALLGLFLFIFEDFKKQDSIHFPVDSTDAPNLQALFKLGQYLDRRFHDLALIYEDFLDADLFDLLTQNVDLDAESLAHYAKLSKGITLEGNLGQPRKQQGKRASVSQDHIERKKETSNTARPSVARKERKMEETKKSTSLADRISGGSRSSRPKSRSSRQDGNTDLVWVADQDLPGGGYYANHQDILDGVATPPPGAQRGGRTASRGRTTRGGRTSGRAGGRTAGRDAPVLEVEISREVVEVYIEDIRGEGDNAYFIHNGDNIYFWDDLNVDIEELLDGGSRGRSRGRTTRSGRTSPRGRTTRERGRTTRGGRASQGRTTRGRTSSRGRGRQEEEVYIVEFEGEDYEYSESDIREDDQGEYVLIDGCKVDV